MSYDVKVSGIPSDVKLQTLISLFSDILSMTSSDFYLRALPSNGPEKEILLSFPTYIGAQLVQQKLDTFIYKHNNISHIFTAQMDGCTKLNHKKPKSKSSYQKQNFKGSYRQKQGCQLAKRNQDRSRSPHYRDTSSQLDMQIEILRKQRMILEEERKLLEEQKKLEELKRKSFNNQTLSVSKNVFEDIEKPGPSSNPTQKKSLPKQLTFYQASRVLLKKMNMFIQKYSSLEERKALLMRLRTIIKQRMAIVVAADGQGEYQTHKVIRLYRSQYPPSEDEKLVKEALEDIKRFLAEGISVANTEIVQTASKGAKAKDEPDGVKSAAGDHKLEDKMAAAKDTTLSGYSNICNNETEAKTRENQNNEKPTKKVTEKRLYFHNASGVLVKKMKVHINKHSPPEKRKLLEEYLRSTLKKRLAVIVAGQPIYQTFIIIKMYRDQHPQTEDEELIKQLLNDVINGDVPDDIMQKNAKENNVLNEKTAVIDDKTPVEKVITDDTTNQPDQAVDKEGIDCSENIVNNVDNKIKVMAETVQSPNIKKDNTEANTEIVADVNNAENTFYKKENDSKIDLVSCSVENETSEYNIDNFCGENNNTKTEVGTTNHEVKALEKPSIEKDSSDENTEVAAEVKPVEEISNEMEIDSKIHLVGCNVESDTAKFDIANHCNSKNDDNTDVAAEAIEKCIDDVAINGVKDNHGVKRKNDEDDDNLMKVAKTDHEVDGLV